MTSKVQILRDSNGEPLFAVIPYKEYVMLTDNEDKLITRESLLSSDQRRIRLPNGGPDAYIDLVRFADYCQRLGLIDIGQDVLQGQEGHDGEAVEAQTPELDIAVNQRAQSLDKFPSDQRNTLDPFVRRHFLAPDSPYRNTMQATTEVVDALVESGMFKRIKKSYPYFYRPVNALEVQVAPLLEYLKKMGPTDNPIQLYTKE